MIACLFCDPARAFFAFRTFASDSSHLLKTIKTPPNPKTGAGEKRRSQQTGTVTTTEHPIKEGRLQHSFFPCSLCEQQTAPQNGTHDPGSVQVTLSSPRALARNGPLLTARERAEATSLRVQTNESHDVRMSRFSQVQKV
jgi:hypothetical protein